MGMTKVSKFFFLTALNSSKKSQIVYQYIVHIELFHSTDALSLKNIFSTNRLGVYLKCFFLIRYISKKKIYVPVKENQISQIIC